MDFILGWVENNSSVLVCDIHHIVALFCSYLPETYSSSLTYSHARWSKREAWLWLVYLFHWFVLCFALPFPCSWRPTLLYIRLCIPIWKGPGNVITGHGSWVLRMNKAPPGGLGLHIDLEWEWFLGIFRTAIWIRLFVSCDVSWSCDVWDWFPDVCHFSFQTVRRLNKYACWNCMRKHVLRKEFIEIEVREVIVEVTGFRWNLFSIWVVLEDQVSLAVEIQISDTGKSHSWRSWCVYSISNCWGCSRLQLSHANGHLYDWISLIEIHASTVAKKSPAQRLPNPKAKVLASVHVRRRIVPPKAISKPLISILSAVSRPVDPLTMNGLWLISYHLLMCPLSWSFLQNLSPFIEQTHWSRDNSQHINPQLDEIQVEDDSGDENLNEGHVTSVSMPSRKIPEGNSRGPSKIWWVVDAIKF